MDKTSQSSQTTTKPLEGILVVAVEQAVAAPLCTARLSDSGARVLKIERSTGDFARGYDDAAEGDSSYFVWANHGKESIELNFKDPDDAALLHRILAEADVFIQNLAPGATERAGFGSDDLRSRYPQLITCDISGYGQCEELDGMKAYDLLVQAESGLVSISGSPDGYGRIGISLCDIGAGVTAYAGILEALCLRRLTGEGSGIAVSLFDVSAEWMSVPLIHCETGSGAPERVGLRHPSIAPYGAFPGSDGKLTLLSIQNEREWHRLCQKVLGDQGLESDPRFTSNLLRVKNREALDLEISSITEKIPTDEFRENLKSASIAFGAINSVNDLAAHSALRRRKVVNTENKELSLPAHPVVRYAAGRENEVRTVPQIGEHTEAVKSEFSLEKETA